MQFRVLGGASSRVAPDETAYAHRTSAIMLNVVRATEDDESAARQWTEELAEALYQGDDGAYVNFFGPADADRIQAAYPAETLVRLRRIKPTTTRRTFLPATTTSGQCERCSSPESDRVALVTCSPSPRKSRGTFGP